MFKRTDKKINAFYSFKKMLILTYVTYCNIVSSSVFNADLPCFKHMQLVVENPILYYNKNHLYSMTQRDSDGTSTTSNPFQSDGFTHVHVDRISMELSILYF